MTEKLSEKVKRLIRPDVQALKAYHVPDARGLIKLDAMENPYAWPESLKTGWLSVLAQVDVNRYPDPACTALQAPLRNVLCVPTGAELLLGNGSDELIQILLLALARPGAVVLAPTPTFVMYELIARWAGLQFVGVPLKNNFILDGGAMLEAIEKHRPAVVFLAYPNNPTGNLFDVTDVEAILQHAPGLVVVDEAYHAFAQTSFIGRLNDYDNLLVMRTLSKQGLAGLRFGILAGAPAWLGELDKVRLPYNINSLTQASVEFALAHRTAFEDQCRTIRHEREALYQTLASLPGIELWPSKANFILFRTLNRAASDVHAALRQAGVLIKNLDGAGGVLAGCLRVTVGTPAENRAFLDALKTILC